MQKIYISIFLISFLINLNIDCQNQKNFWTNSRVELLLSYDMINQSIGTIIEGKKQIWNRNHFEGYSGLALEYLYQEEKNKYLDYGLNGHDRDLGIYGVSNCIYYPFNKKTFFIGLEIFIGITNFKSKGSLKMPKHDINKTYKNSYTYFNYGITPMIGYNFGRVSTSLFSKSSLKGILDSGRNRFGDNDSRFLVGLNIGYQFKPKNN